MSKALVIKNADFSTNKLTTVQFIQEIPCTGITLNKSSASIGDTETLVATVTPGNTTDSITWGSSDTDVATVVNGVVTAVSNGTTIITATCGSYSATCNVTVALPLFFAMPGLIQVATKNNNLLDVATIGNYTIERFASLGGTKGEYIAAWLPAIAGTDFEELYPYPIPKGATKINVEMNSNIAALVVFYNSKEHGTKPGSEYLFAAMTLDGETAAGGTSWSIPSWTYGNRVIDISSVSGVDSFTLGLSFKTDADYDNFDPTNPGITITFGFD